MAKFDLYAPILIAAEGGWSNDPDDAGGATMAGVTIATYRAYRKNKGLPAPSLADLRRITRDEWAEIMKTLYWDKVKGDQIVSQSVANIWADWAVNSGASAANRRVQKLLGVFQDGIVGAKTLAAANTQPAHLLFARIKSAREVYYRTIATGRRYKFLRGWLNRLARFEYVG